jgi:hypothetical protein
MITIPSLVDRVLPRPNKNAFEESSYVPDPSHNIFWQKVYEELYSFKFSSPVTHNVNKFINPSFGYFGACVHPTTHEIGYFHAGIEMEFSNSRKVFPIANGILEYSGYGAINGHYVLLSHPQIKTEDGYILHSMYCHLKKPLVKFSSYQKMLREISLGTYPEIIVPKKTQLGETGASGVTRDENPRTYVQLDFRKYGHQPIAIDPLMVLNFESAPNETATISNKKQFDAYMKNLTK